MKKLVALVMILSLSFSMVGCGGNGDEIGPDGNTTQEKPPAGEGNVVEPEG